MSKSPFTLRPVLPADTLDLVALARLSIEDLTTDDCSDAQREAWADTLTGDQAGFARRLAAGLTLVAIEAGVPVGFVTLVESRIDLLFVSPDHSRQGVATLLLDAILRLAGARGIETLRVDASDTARDLFAKHGFVPQSRNTVACGDEWLGNTTMLRKREPAPS